VDDGFGDGELLMRKMQTSERWFRSRSGQAQLDYLPRIPVFVRSNEASVRKGGLPTRGAKEYKPFIVGESEVGGEEVAL